MSSRKYQVAVIMVNFNSSQFTLDCVHSLMEKTTKDLSFQVIIVDNASRTEEYDKLTALEGDRQVTVFRSRLNTGFSGANMLGVQLAHADYYYFLNNDCVIKEDCLSTLYAFMQSHTDAGICSGEMYNAQDRYEANFGHFPVLASKLFGMGFLRLLHPGRYPQKNVAINAPLKVDLVNGSSMFVRADAFDDIGGMDTQYFLYCEEEDLALRLRQKGLYTYIVPGAKYQHFVSQSTTKDNSINLTFQKEFYISFLSFYRKHYGTLATAVIRVFYFFRMLRKVFRHADYARLAFFIAAGAPASASLRFRQQIMES